MRSSKELVVGAVVLIVSSGCGKKNEEQQRPAPTAQPVETSGAVVSGGPSPAGGGEPKTTYDRAQLAVFAPLPPTLERPDNPLTPEKVALGKRIFFDARLSKGKDVSCSSCHDPSKAGADGAALSTGTGKAKGKFNTPSVFNAAGAIAQGWDGSAATLEAFVLPHMSDPTIMGAGDAKHVVDVVGATPGYKAELKAAFPDQKDVTPETVSKAVGAYVRKLVTPGRWDKFLAGDESALTDAEKGGLGTFMDAGCTTCHAGPYVGGAMFQKLGLAKPWPAPAGNDPGRFAVTHQDADKAMYRVPSLRNVTKTAPYLHDGSVATLEETVKLMEHHQIGRDLSDAQVKAIVTFLHVLEGEPPADLVAKPAKK